jgi:general secretion pathway protein J
MTTFPRCNGGVAPPRPACAFPVCTAGQRRRRIGVAGFTLLEALVAVTLMGMILAALGAITAQWLPGWNRGFMRVQRGELFSVALNSLAADLAAAEFVTANRDAKRPLFDGTPTGVILVRSAIGPNTEPGLEVVRIAEGSDRQGIAMVRMRTPFAPFGSGDVSATNLPFADPVVLLRAPFRVSFSYSSGDGTWQDDWRQSNQLPATVRFLVRDTTTGRTLAVSSATMVHVNLQVCADTASSGAPSPGSAASSSAPASSGAPAPSGAPASPGAPGAAATAPASSGCGSANTPGGPPGTGASPNSPAQGQ